MLLSCRHYAPYVRQIATPRARVYMGLRRESGAGAACTQARGAKRRTPGLGKRTAKQRRRLRVFGRPGAELRAHAADQPKKKSRENSLFGKRDIIARAGCPRAMNNVNPGTI